MAERGDDRARASRRAAVALVCFNGKTAARALPAWRDAGYATLVLPSSSPAYTRPFAEKLARVAAGPRIPARCALNGERTGARRAGVARLAAAADPRRRRDGRDARPRARHVRFPRSRSRDGRAGAHRCAAVPAGGPERRAAGGGRRAPRLRRHVQHVAIAARRSCRCGTRRWRSSWSAKATSCCSRTAFACAAATRSAPSRIAGARSREANRRLDAQGALAFLQARADVAPDRVAVLGWSHGGSAVLAVLDARQPAVAAWRDARAIVAVLSRGRRVLPGLRRVAARQGRLRASPRRCASSSPAATTGRRRDPASTWPHRLSAAGEPVKITVYPETYHGFDGPTGQPQRRLDVPNGVHPGKGVTVAPNPAVRADAYVRLEAFLHAHLREAGNGADRPRASAAGSP